MGQRKITDLERLGYGVRPPKSDLTLELHTDCQVGFAVVDPQGELWIIDGKIVLDRVAEFLRARKIEQIESQESHEILGYNPLTTLL